MITQQQNNSEMRFSHPSQDTLMVHIGGSWLLETSLQSIELLENEIQSTTTVRTVNFDTKNLTSWDSSLLIFLLKVFDTCAKHSIHIQMEGIPQGVRTLLDLASLKTSAERDNQEGREKIFSRKGG